MIRSVHNFWNHKWFLSIAAGLLLGMSFPPFPFPFLQFPALIFIFRLISLCQTAKELAYYIYPGFLIWNLIVSYWLMMASLAAGIAAILANAVLMAIVAMLQYTAQKKCSYGWLTALLQTSFWVSFEYLHHHWDLSWPWLTLANGWANWPALIQYISITGFWGVSFWVILSSALFFQAMHLRKRTLKIAALTVLIIFPAFSLIQLPGVTTQSDNSVNVVVAQPNFDSYKPFGGLGSSQKALDLLFSLSNSVRTAQTDLVLWPENGIHPNLSNISTNDAAATLSKSKLINKAQRWQTTIVGGTGFFEFYKTANPPPLPMYSNGRPYLVFNAALGFYPNGHTEVYRKHNLVPVVERFPFVHFFDTIDIFGWVNWSAIQNFGQGYKADQFRVNSTRTPALICYDSVYPGWVRNFILNGAGFISIITNDGWWGDTSGHWQHFSYARLRAIEFHRWVVRSANNGISGIIAPDGSVKKQTDYWTRTAFRYKVPVFTDLTWYARLGDWLPALLLILSLGGLIYFIAIGSQLERIDTTTLNRKS